MKRLHYLWLWLILSLITLPTAASEAQTPEDAIFGERVRQYLLDNPQVVVEAIERWQAQQAQAERARVAALIEEHQQALLHHPEDPVGGNPNGDVTLVEFIDYNCVFCRRLFPALLQLRQQDPQLRVVFKAFPILGLGSEFAAKAALAAQQQGAYQRLHDALMQVEGALDESRVLAIAEAQGLDMAQLQLAIQTPAFDALFQRNYRLGQSLGITGTPSFIIGDRLVDGSTDLATLQQLIQQTREKNP